MFFWILPLAKLLLHLFTTQGYGYFRDEFYYLACADHPALGYVDHPPLSIMVLWVVRHLFGDSLFALRLVPAIAGALTIAVVGKTAERMGGGRFAQSLAMTAALIAPDYLGTNFYYSMNSLDLLIWAVAGYLIVRLAQTPTPRLWLLLGLVLALGLANKIGILWLGGGLLVGLLLTPSRRTLMTRWPWIAGAMAVLGLAPYVVWQMQNNWATREWMHNATTNKMVAVSLLDFMHGQLNAMHPFNLLIWGAGLVFLLLTAAGRPFRILGWMWLTVAVILAAASASRAGYLAAAYTWLFAAGGVAWERMLAKRAAFWKPALVGLLLIGGAIVLPLAVPVLAVEDYIRYAARLGQKPGTEEKKEIGALPQWFADMNGWPEMVDTIAKAWESLPPEDRAKAPIIAPDYGVAGAIDLLGKKRGLPGAISTHNNYWIWGPGSYDGSVAVVISSNEERLKAGFESVERAGTIECGYCMPYENHKPVWIVRKARLPVAEIWAKFKNFD